MGSICESSFAGGSIHLLAIERKIRRDGTIG